MLGITMVSLMGLMMDEKMVHLKELMLKMMMVYWME